MSPARQTAQIGEGAFAGSSPLSVADILEELEIPWLSEMIANSVAQLGYPVGCGVAPKPEHLAHAAKLLFARYKSMIAAVEAGRITLTPKDSPDV